MLRHLAHWLVQHWPTFAHQIVVAYCKCERVIQLDTGQTAYVYVRITGKGKRAH